jgi:hypothetical protein
MDIFQLVSESGFVDPPEAVSPPSHMAREAPEALQRGPDLDAWLWDENFADERYDTVLEVNKRMDLVKAYGGERPCVKLLVAAAAKGDLTLIKALVKRDAAASNTLMDEIGRNYLHVACEHGHTLAAAWTVKNGMDVNKATLYGLTPLMCACAWGNEVCAHLLLDFGADATLRDRHGRTALSFASDGVRSALVHHPAMEKWGRDVMGADIWDQWVPPPAGSSRKESDVNEQFQGGHAGKGYSEKYNMTLMRGVAGAAMDQAADEKKNEGGGETADDKPSGEGTVSSGASAKSGDGQKKK